MSADNRLIDILRKAEDFLAKKGIPSARLEAQLIFAHFLGLKRIELFTQPDRPLVPSELETLRNALVQKSQGVPTAQILGSKDFYGRTFRVTADVLIPRPETEELVEQALKEQPKPQHIVDAGTGTGCIGITLAIETQAPALTLMDISPSALLIAEENAHALLDESVTLMTAIEADFTQPGLRLKEPAELFISNPPYVLSHEYADLDRTVREYEPRLALVADDFKDLHKKLIACVMENLIAGGLFALETHPAKTTEVAEWAREAGFTRVEIRNDLAARPHFIFAWK